MALTFENFWQQIRGFQKVVRMKLDMRGVTACVRILSPPRGRESGKRGESDEIEGQSWVIEMA
jgi:hypothetical protein